MENRDWVRGIRGEGGDMNSNGNFNTFFQSVSPSHLLAQYVVVTVCLKAGLETQSWNKVSILEGTSSIQCSCLHVDLLLRFGKVISISHLPILPTLCFAYSSDDLTGWQHISNLMS